MFVRYDCNRRHCNGREIYLPPHVQHVLFSMIYGLWMIGGFDNGNITLILVKQALPLTRKMPINGMSGRILFTI